VAGIACAAAGSAPGIPLTGSQMCVKLKNKKLNGNRDLNDLLHHLKTEPLVVWSFDPGKRPNGEERTKPPISHGELIQNFTQWMHEEAPCPAQ
jgi:hypothetical protein